MTNDDTHERNAQNGENVSTDGSGTTRRTVLQGTSAAAAGLAMGASSLGSAAARDIPVPKLKRDGNHLVDPCGEKVILRGVNIIDPRRAQRPWRNADAQAMFDMATNSEWANHVIRVPMQPQDISAADTPRQGGNESYMDHDGNWGPILPLAFTKSTLKTYLEKYVDPLVEQAKQSGTYIQLDYHRHFPIFHQAQYGGPSGFTGCGAETFPHDLGMCGERGVLWHGADQVSELKGLAGSPDDAFYETETGSQSVRHSGGATVAEAFDEEMELFWSTVANRYAGEPHVLFDVFNEPTGPYAGDWGSPTRAPAGGEETGINTDVTHENAKPYWELFLERVAPWIKTVEENAPGSVKTVGSPRWSQYTYWAKDMEVNDVGSTYSGIKNMCYTGHRYTHENLQPMSKFYGEAAEEVPMFFNEFGWAIEGGTNEFPFIDGTTSEYPSGADRPSSWPPRSAKGNQGDDYEQFFNNYDVHPVSWCFDHQWSPAFFAGQNFDSLRDRNVQPGGWWKDFAAARADQDNPSNCPNGNWGGTDGLPGGDGGTEDTTPPTSPSNPTATTTSSSVTVSWDAATDPDNVGGGVDHYLVEWGTTGSKTVTGTEATISGLMAGTTYEVSITAVDTAGNMSDAVSVNATTSSGDGTTPPSDMTVSLDVETVTVGGQAKAAFTLSNAPNGVSGYTIQISVADTSVATITNASTDASFTALETPQYASDGSSVTLYATDLNQTVQDGAQDIRLGSVTFSGQSSGETDVALTVETSANDDGGRLNPQIMAGTLTVGSPAPPAVADDGARPTDPDNDGHYEDLNGNGRIDSNDVVMYFQHREQTVITDHLDAYDYNDSGRIDYNDIVSLFQER